jgi:predicted MFS family arabinose efflux permease
VDSETNTNTNKQHQTRWLALFVLGLSLLAGVVDSSVINVATPAIMEEFNSSESQTAILVTVYSLVTASFLLLFGKIGNKYGLRLLQAFGTGLFGLTSLMIALAPSLWFMSGMRAFAGLAAAMASATGLALVHSIFKGKERSLAFGIQGATASFGIAIGPVLGGLAVTYFSWRLAFLINVPVCLFAVIGSYLWIREVKHENVGSIDYAGAAIIGFGIFTIILALILGPTMGWWMAKTSISLIGISPVPWLLVLGFILTLVLYPHWARIVKAHGKEPIFNLGLLELHSFRGGILASFARQIAQFAPIYALAIFLEETAHWTASETGFVFLASAIGGVIAGLIGGWLANRWGPKPVVIAGKLMMAAAILWLLVIIDVSIQSYMLLGPLFLFGLSIGLAGAQLTTVTFADVPLSSAGDASAAKSSIARVGTSFGAAFVGILIAISINDVLIMALLFVLIALALAFTLPNVKKNEGESTTKK